MKIEINTKEDPHEDIRKVIKLLQHIIGDSQEVFTNEPQAAQETASPIANIFGDASNLSGQSAASEPAKETAQSEEPPETPDSTGDLFAELFSEEELKKMDVKKENEDEESEEDIKSKAKDKKYSIEFY